MENEIEFKIEKFNLENGNFPKIPTKWSKLFNKIEELEYDTWYTLEFSNSTAYIASNALRMKFKYHRDSNFNLEAIKRGNLIYVKKTHLEK